MKLSRERVAILSKRLVEALLKENLISFRSKKELLESRIESILLNDLQVEDRLNAEVKEILKNHEREIERGEVDYQRMFQMIKRQLAEKRNLVL